MNDPSVVEEDEPECRVCRGPAEEDHPLYKPCRCSGSIGCTHQDCLQSWLAVNNATKCELCGTPFRFTNQYAPNTPDQLPVIEVLLGFTRNIVATWLPLWLRISMAAALWLLVAPLATACIYHGWMHGNMLTTGNSILKMKWNVVVDELVSGAVLVALVLFSFLSLMSLVDFLRAEWQDPRQPAAAAGPPNREGQGAANARNAAPQPAENDNNNNNDNENNNNNNNPPPPPEIDEANVDAAIFNHYQTLRRRGHQGDDFKQSAENEQTNSSSETTSSHELQPRASTAAESSEATDPLSTETDPSEDSGIRPDPPGNSTQQNEIVNNNNMQELQDFLQEAERADAADDESDNDNNEEEEEEDDEDDDNDEGQEDDDGENDPAVEDAEVNNDNDNRNAAGNNRRNNNNNNMDNDALDDDPVLDADLNIALDEVLGVRGPLWIVVRNLMWLLAFNTLYLAIFAFVPRVIGSMAVSLWFPISSFSFAATTTADSKYDDNNASTTDWTTTLAAGNETMNSSVSAVVNVTDNNDTNNSVIDYGNSSGVDFSVLGNATINISDYSIGGIYRAVEEESARLSTTFRLNDFLLVMIGYTCAAGSIVLMRYLWILTRVKSNNDNHNNNEGGGEEEGRDPFLREGHPGLVMGIEIHHHGGAQVEINPLQRERQNQLLGNNNIDEEGHVAIGVAVDAVLEAAASIVKVGVLLFLKMFLLPVMLGFCLDLSTLSLFQRTMDDIILYAGRDLFSFLFLHWVAGISFMLLVTVSVLQLREVVHPNVLAHIIRPQEPQPDLLGNLLHDSLVTHGKRLFLSLIIYVLLLILQVHIPVHIFVSSIPSSPSFWQLKFYYLLTPRLQIPVELCIFHLCMLAFLEKNKNSIGELQHYWLKAICQFMDFGNSIIPHEVEKFRFLGSRAVFADDAARDVVDSFWYELAREPSGSARERMIESKLRTHFSNNNVENMNRFTTGETSVKGKRIIKSRSDYIRLPVRDGDEESILLPTTIGRYRLNRGPNSEMEKEDPSSWSIELWEEVVGTAISRPPEGWDDLGVGGADVQGRWAWDREKKSFVEESVARRTILFPLQQPMFRKCIVVAKLALLIVFSWVAATVATCVLLMVPLAVGRVIFSLLWLPPKYVHDPFCFAVGTSIILPLLKRFILILKADDQSLSSRFWAWLRRAQAPPLDKALILSSIGFLWFCFIPILIGLAFDMLFSWTDDRFTDQKLDNLDVFPFWAFGSVVLLGWSGLCVAGVLTGEFWMGIFVNEVNRVEAAHDPSVWQGAHGKVARFWDIWKDVLQGWEWDEVNLAVLFNDCTFPILRVLFVVLFAPVVVWVMPNDWLSVTQAHSLSLLVKTSAMAVVSIHVGILCKRQIRNWFNAIHRTARDDRYLIGQLLMNHDEQ